MNDKREHQDRTNEELEAASFMARFSTTTQAAASSKHESSEVQPPAKKAKRASKSSKKAAAAPKAKTNKVKPPKPPKPSRKKSPPTPLVLPALKPAPYFYYTDHSRDIDSFPLAPLTSSGHHIHFPVKMHAILSNPKLQHILRWDEHGRSFRIVLPRQFEEYVLPRYFEHSRMCSFLRQLNGWGFRRLLGANSRVYYEEHFLRGMPWLCKKMKRHKVGEKAGIDEEHEPDLHAISLEFPLQDHPISPEIQVVMKTIEAGPKARMPFDWVPSQHQAQVKPKKGEKAAGANAGPEMDSKPAAKASAPDAEMEEAAAPSSVCSGAEGEENADVQPSAAASAAAYPTPATSNETLLLDGSNSAHQTNSLNRTSESTNADQSSLRQAMGLGVTDQGFMSGMSAANQCHNANMQDLLGKTSNPHPMAPSTNVDQSSIGTHQPMGLDATEGFMAGVAAATQCHNANMQRLLGDSFHPQTVPYLADGSANFHNQVHHYNGLRNAQVPMQGNNNVATDPLLQALIYEAIRNNTIVGNMISALQQSQAAASALQQSQAAQVLNPAAMVQRERRANEALEAIRRHQATHGNNAAGSAVPQVHPAMRGVGDESTISIYLLSQQMMIQQGSQSNIMSGNGAMSQQMMIQQASQGNTQGRRSGNGASSDQLNASGSASAPQARAAMRGVSDESHISNYLLSQQMLIQQGSQSNTQGQRSGNDAPSDQLLAFLRSFGSQN